ncbi:MAG: NUDIX hydrolase [Parcubacteria group bacterium Gr01-1014_17]|nr:MAG: NUDIX hydrolase [Parcubacteria group bacterium Gr01-1014_17]
MTKILLKLIHAVRRFYWRCAKPITRGVRTIIVGDDGKVLLVKHQYENGWFLPGGKVRKRESDEHALHRELSEELGISDIAQITRLGEYMNTYEYKKDTIIVFVVRSFIQKPKKHFEIAEQQFFYPRALPESASPGTRRRIEEWLGQRDVNSQW